MASKYLLYKELAEQTAISLTKSSENWKAYLTTAARLYKYPFHEQLMIYSQRPDAVACADFDLWNDRMGRFVKRGSKGIALTDENGGLRYVFDVSDTGSRDKSKPFSLWEYHEDDRDTLTAMFSQRYGIDSKDLFDGIEKVSRKLAEDYWHDNKAYLRDIVDGSFLEEYDDDNLMFRLRETVCVSTTYSVISRCGLSPEDYFEPEDFMNIFDFNTVKSIRALGIAVSETNRSLLRQIEISIKNHKRENAERSTQNEQNHLHETGRLSNPEYSDTGEKGTLREIRSTEESIPEELPPIFVPGYDSDRDTSESFGRDRQDSKPSNRTDDDGNEGEGKHYGTDESGRSDEMVPNDEQSESTSGGNNSLRVGLQLTLFPTEEEQIARIDSAESSMPFAVSFSDDEVNSFLRYGSNSDKARLYITAEFMKERSIDDKAKFLQGIFHGGYGLNTGQGKIAAWYAEDGIHLNRGDTARYSKNAVLIPWTEAAERITNMLASGTFASNVEVAEAPGIERLKIAETLWYLYRDITEEARTNGILSSLNREKFAGFPDETAELSDNLRDPIFRERLIAQFATFISAYEEDKTILRFKYHKPYELMQSLQSLRMHYRPFSSDISDIPAPNAFITEDELNEAITGGSSVAGGKGRIYRYFTETHSNKDKADFLKNEYGIGGHSHALSGASGSDESHEARGERFKKTDCAPVEMKWLEVAKRIDMLIARGRYLSDEEIAQLEAIEKQELEASEHIETDTMLPERMEQITEAFEAAGYTYDDINSYGGYLVFHGEGGDGCAFKSWEEADEWINGVIFDEPERNEAVERVLHPDRYTEETDEFPYSVGNTVYLEDGTAFIIENIGDHEIQLRDPTLLYPILRAESRENFLRLVEQYPQKEPEKEYETETVAVYPAEENHLPYDVVVETIHVSEPEKPTPPKNFHITDEHLGEGGAKAKFRMNMDAINLLKELEFDNRQATPEEQEILSKYVGWGGLADAFDETKENWADEFQELYTTLTPEEYAAARASTLNAHYTSPTVIKAIYDAVGNMGFANGNILEPAMGIGNFFGMLPQEMSASKLYGVELDSITGRIAKQLYPNADITVAGFETTDRRDFFDLAIGNVPFGQYQVNDRVYNKLGFSIHNYFFAKSLDQVRPGGIVAFVTSRYTLDAKDPSARKYLAQRAEFLGAIRLPNNAFRANAGTDVVSDIIFLQKRDRPITIEPDWVHLGENEDGFAINSYFVEHPEMILGRQTSESTQYGKQDFTVEPIEGLNLSDQLTDAIKNIHGNYTVEELSDIGEDEEIRESIPADPSVKNYSFTVVDGEVYFRENSVMVRPELNATAKERIKGLVELRECVNHLINEQMDYFTSDETIAQRQAELDRLYDKFTAKYGLINSRANSQVFASDSSYYLLCSLEILDEEGNLARKADMFTKRTIKPHEVVTSVDTASEALALSVSEKACVDMEYMSSLTGKTEKELADELRGVIYLDFDRTPDGAYTYRTADDFLSGNVREKLAYYENAMNMLPKDANHYDEILANVEALRKAQPKDLDASEIEVRLGATWIDKDYIKEFMWETFDMPSYLRRTVEVNYSPYTAEWNITNKNMASYNDVNIYMTYGTERANAFKILEDTLNLRDVRIYDTKTDADGKERRVLNSKETTLAAQKQQAIKDAFRDWIWKDADRRQELVEKYNVLFNSTRPREYDGSHLKFSGMNPEITLRPHQLNAVAHIIYGGNTLLAHEVGAGKTFEMVAAIMESKRLGLCQKALLVVPNHLTEQWASEFLRLYPSANILAATKKDFEPHNRKKFCARIATGDYDAVIIGHSQFERIPVSYERQERLLMEQIDEITEGLEELKYSRAERFTVKSLERTKKGLEARLKKLQESDRKDDVITFEQLGVDRLYVDEAHNFKNLFLYTKMRNVAGLSTTDAQKSSDMFLKCRYIDEITENKGVVFATGTPVSNSMTELYTMMRYLQHDTIRDKGLAHFDCWASTFGETTTAIELAPEGTGYRARTRFAKFFNLPELMTLFKEAADIKTSDQLNLPTPTPVYHNIVAQPTEIQKGMVQELSERAAKVHAGIVDSSTDNMLKITSDGRKLGLDQRIINPDLPDEPQSKVNLCVDNIYKIYEDGNSDKLTQLVFCDLSTPKNASPTQRAAKTTAGNIDSPELHAVLSATDEPEEDKEFSVYDDIRDKLVKRGVPREEIAFIHEANTEVRKKELFAKVRSGQVRVLMGSTAKLGAGTNVQDRLIALHDLDAPWRPGDLEQRSGRIIRQGNKNPEVHIFRYVTEATFDAYLWQTLENKQKFISQIMTSKSPVRSCEDIDETSLSYAEIKSLCAGDERIKEKMDLDIEVSKLKLMKASYKSQQYRLEDNLLKQFPEQIERTKGFIAGFEADIKTLAEHPHPKDGFAGMTVRGDHLTDKENAGAALLDACKEVKGLEPMPIGNYRGFQMSLTLEDFGKEYVLTLKGKMTHRVSLGKDARGNLIRIDNALSSIQERLNTSKEKLENLYAQVENAKAELGKPFPQEEELRVKSARLTELNTLLDIDGKGEAEQISDETEQEATIAKREPASVLDRLKQPLPPCNPAGKKHNEREM